MEREYVFGTTDRNGIAAENLKTAGDTHTDLKGYVQVIREYPDQTITDSFRIVEHYNSAENAEGVCFDWYEIAEHNRDTDRTPPIKSDVGTLTEALNALAGITTETEA